MKLALAFLLICLPAYGATFQSDGSATNTQAKIDAAGDGDTVILPSGNLTWTTNVVIVGKGIRLLGSGSGRVITRSGSSVSVGTGSKTFTVDSGLGLAVGTVLRVDRTGGDSDGTLQSFNWALVHMIGTVTAYSGDTLTLNVTTSSGSGTHTLWQISTPAATTVIHSATNTMLGIIEDTTHSVEIVGIRFAVGTPAGGNQYHIDVQGSGKPVLIHDCYFENNTTVLNVVFLVNRGVIWNCSFTCLPFSVANNAFKLANHSDTGDWTNASTMGTNDLTGLQNLYIEDCDFTAFMNAVDWDSNGRVVVRYCTFDNAGTTTHGNDSSPQGVRHYQWYNNTFIFSDQGIDTMPLNWFFFLRGGTGVFTDNEIPNITSGWWGDKNEFTLGVLNLREAGWAQYSCWGADIPGVQYPAPRQIGYGYVTGTGSNNPTWGYQGDQEPLYIWNNTGAGAEIVAIADGTAESGACTNPDTSVDYIIENRDYFVGTPKPGFQKFRYPHPLRQLPVRSVPVKIKGKGAKFR